MGRETVIEKDTVPQFPRSFLQGQGDQVPESALRRCILIREKAIIGIKADIGTPLHCFGKEVRPQFACQDCGNSFGEK